jgi:hypothetical protein
MKPFEDQFAAWLDGKLSATERAAFEQQFPEEVAAFAEPEVPTPLGDFLRRHGAAPELANADFFNHQILEQITAGVPEKRPAVNGWSLFGLPRLAWSGFGFVAAALVLFLTIIPHGKPPLTGSRYVAQVLKTHAGDRGLSATAFHSTENNLTVVWVDGYVDSNDAPSVPHAQ